MLNWIEVTSSKEPTVEYLNLDKVESFTKLNEGCLVHFGHNNTLTIKESYEEIREMFLKIKQLERLT